MNSAATMWPPSDFVYARKRRAWVGVHSPEASRVPTLVAIDVTTCASTAREKSTTPFHCARLSTPPKPAGGAEGRPIFVEVRAEPAGRARHGRRGRRRRLRGSDGAIRLPELPARHLDHLDVVRLEARVDVRGAGHGLRSERGRG